MVIADMANTNFNKRRGEKRGALDLGCLTSTQYGVDSRVAVTGPGPPRVNRIRKITLHSEFDNVVNSISCET